VYSVSNKPCFFAYMLLVCVCLCVCVRSVLMHVKIRYIHDDDNYGLTFVDRFICVCVGGN